MGRIKQTAIERINFLASIGIPKPLAEKVECDSQVGRIEFKNADTGAPEILLYEAIGFDWFSGEGMTAKAFNEQLSKIDSPSIKVRINSPGGDVFDGIAMYNMLAQHPSKIDVVVEGIAASAATIVAMAGDTVSIHESAQIMIHDAWTMVVGNQQDMLEMADLLGKIDGQIADLYAARSGKPASDFRDVMNSDTYLTGKESVDLGIADTLIETKRKEKPTAGAPKNPSAKRLIKLDIEKKRLFSLC